MVLPNYHQTTDNATSQQKSPEQMQVTGTAVYIRRNWCSCRSICSARSTTVDYSSIYFGMYKPTWYQPANATRVHRNRIFNSICIINRNGLWRHHHQLQHISKAPTQQSTVSTAVETGIIDYCCCGAIVRRTAVIQHR